jgi:hypothetical protein
MQYRRALRLLHQLKISVALKTNISYSLYSLVKSYYLLLLCYNTNRAFFIDEQTKECPERHRELLGIN